MSWLSGLSATASPWRAASARVSALLASPPSGKRRNSSCSLRGREQEIALIARGIGRHVQFGPVRAGLAPDIVAGRHAIGVQVARGIQKVAEFYPLVAADAGHGRRAGQIGVGELLDHQFAELVFVIKHIMRKPDAFRDSARVVDILPGAARPLFRQRGAVVVKLQGDADHVIAFLGQLRRHDRAVDPAGHRDNNARLCGRLGKAE